MSGLLPCLLSLCGGLGFGPYEQVTTMLTIIVRWLRIRSLRAGYYHAYDHCAVA